MSSTEHGSPQGAQPSAPKVSQDEPEKLNRVFTLHGPAVEYFQYPGREALLEGGARCGKAQRLSSTVWTPDGPKRMGDINVGDVVVGGDGRKTLVIGVHDQPIQTIFKLTFSTGETTHTTAEHLWDCCTRPNHKTGKIVRGIWTTEKIRARLARSKRFDIWIPQAVAQFRKRNLPLDPYVMGVLLGDGSLSGSSVSFAKNARDAELVERVRQRAPRGVTAHRDGRTWGVPGVAGIMRSLGLLGKKSIEKHIPDIYRRASVEQRMELLRGLMDTDGTVDRQSGMPRYSSGSKQLAEDFLEVIQSLGGAGAIHVDRAKCNGKDYGPHYSVVPRFDEARELFTLVRKRTAASNRSKFMVRRLVRKIEPLPEPEPARCITVANPDGLYLTDNFIVTHNSYALLIKANHVARTYPGSRQLIVRQTRKSLNESILRDWREDILWIGHEAVSGSASKEHQDLYRWKNGSDVFFAGLENMRDTASPILSTKWDRIYSVQAEETSQNDWEILATRLSNFKTPYHQLTADCNPAAPSHWLNQRFSPERTSANRTRFPFRHYDNPFFYRGIYPNGEWTKYGREYMNILESTLTGVRRDRFLLSKWVAAEGQILDNWDPRIHCINAELESDTNHGWLLHVEGMETPIRIAYFTAGVDWGWKPDPGCMQLWAYDSPRWHPQVRRFRIAEVMKLEWQSDQWAELAASWWEKYNVTHFSCDPADPEKRNNMNLRLSRKQYRNAPKLAVKCPPIGGGHQRSKHHAAGIDLMREGLLSATGHTRSFFLKNAFPEGIDEGLRRLGRPTCFEQEVESWVYAIDPQGNPTTKPNDRCDQHAIMTSLYDETLNFMRGFGRTSTFSERPPPDSIAALLAEDDADRLKERRKKQKGWK